MVNKVYILIFLIPITIFGCYRQDSVSEDYFTPEERLEEKEGERASKVETLPHLIILMTDFGDRGFLLGSMKGIIYSINNAARIDSLTTSVHDFDIEEASWMLLISSDKYPAGTIFVTIVDPQVGGEREPVIAVSSKGQIHVAPNNGVLTGLLFSKAIEKVYRIDPDRFEKIEFQSIYKTLKIYAPVVAMLSKGTKPEELGEEIPLSNLVEFPFPEPEIQDGNVIGEIVLTDDFGNCITNIKSITLEKAGFKENEMLSILLGEREVLSPYIKNFDEINMGEVGLMPSIDRFLHIAINQGNAAQTFNVRRGERIVIKRVVKSDISKEEEIDL